MSGSPASLVCSAECSLGVFWQALHSLTHSLTRSLTACACVSEDVVAIGVAHGLVQGSGLAHE